MLAKISLLDIPGAVLFRAAGGGASAGCCHDAVPYAKAPGSIRMVSQPWPVDANRAVRSVSVTDAPHFPKSPYVLPNNR